MSDLNNSYLKSEFLDLKEYLRDCYIDVDSFVSNYDEKEVFKNIIKINVLTSDHNQLVNAIEGFTSKFELELNPQGGTTGFSAPARTKAIGIRDVRSFFNIPNENTYCFGDVFNDIEMFKLVAHPFALGNAVDPIKEIAEEVCEDVTNDGVAIKLNELFNNKVSA